MVSDEVYDKCLPLLQDDLLGEEEKTDSIEEILRQDLGLSGKILEDAVLGALWRHKMGEEASSPAPIRAAAVRTRSPAPWQTSRSATPVRMSPRVSSAAMSGGAGLLKRAISSTTIGSPRNSPAQNYNRPPAPKSPALSAYQASDAGSMASETYFDLDGENMNWIVNDEAFTPYQSDFIEPATIDMSPYDILRSVLGDGRSDEELAKSLEAHGYDLGLAMTSPMYSEQPNKNMATPDQPRSYLVGKSMAASPRSPTSNVNGKTPVVCKFILAAGHCARADCRYSHDLTSHVCKYWLAGSCLAGNACMFSHDPTAMMSNLGFNSDAMTTVEDFQLLDHDSFPSLGGDTDTQQKVMATAPKSPTSFLMQSAMNPFANFVPNAMKNQTASQTTSKSTAPASFSGQDDEAFPSLGSNNVRIVGGISASEVKVEVMVHKAMITLKSQQSLLP